MLSAIRSRITYVNVAVTVALVFAMTGGAYAAKKYLITSTKQIRPSVLKSLQGKAGPAGATGAPGPAGVQGPAGANGKDGTNGKDGAAGASGKSVTVTSFDGQHEPVGPPSHPCAENGGNVQEVEGTGVKQVICDGEPGAPGVDGSPWTLGGILPAKKTETGAWSFGPIEAGALPFGNTNPWRIPISFPIPLAAGLTGGHVHFLAVNGKEIDEGGEPTITPTECHGTTAAPSADPGNLCVYTSTLSNVVIEIASIFKAAGSGPEDKGASTAGAVVGVEFLEAGAVGGGTWAVTAP